MRHRTPPAHFSEEYAQDGYCRSCGDENDQHPEVEYCGSCEAQYWEDIAKKSDKVTACFTVLSACMIFLHVNAAYQMKNMAGVSVIALVFVCIQALWFTYFFRSIRSRFSMWCMVIAFIADLIYLGMWFQYGR